MMGPTEARAYGLARRHHNNAIVLMAAIRAHEDGEMSEERLEELMRTIRLHPVSWRYEDSPDFMTKAYDEVARERLCQVLMDRDRVFINRR